MCFTKMIKKLVTALCLLAVVGMFASCANSSGGSSSSGGSDPVKEDIIYKLIYEGETQTTMTGAEFLEFARAFDLKEGKDYRVDNEKKTITFTKSGAEKSMGSGQGGNGSGGTSNPDYMLFLEDGAEDIMIMDMDKDDFTKLKAILATSDYTVADRIVTMNDTGLGKLVTEMKASGIVVYKKEMLMPVTAELAGFISTMKVN